MTLTVKEIEAARPRETGYKLADAAGLYLFITPAGAKSWRANYSRAGKQATRTYGQYPAVSLADARKAHAKAREGVDSQTPVAASFEAVARRWLKGKLPELENGKHQVQVENTLQRYAIDVFGQKPIDTIERSELVAAVEAIQAEGHVETAHRVAGRITAVFDFAQDAGVIKAHPAARLTRVLTSRKVKKPMASLPPDEAGELLRAIEGYDEPITRLGLQLMAHTFVRTQELLGFRWNELREDDHIWLVPGERMKRRVPHVVPLSSQARAILAQLRLLTGEGDLVLESPLRERKPISENTLLFALYRLGYRGRMTVHGFRALASTVLNERSKFHPDEIERQLSHKESDAVRAAYNRAEYLPQRRKLMQWYGDWLELQRTGQGPQRATASRRRS